MPKSHQMPIKASPFAHQQAAFNFTCTKFGVDDEKSSGGVALLMEMGTGKSLTAIAAAGSLYLHRKIDRLLIVCPLSIIGVWKEEFEKFADFPYKLTALSGTGEKRKSLLHCISGSGLQVAVINYESCWRMEKALSGWHPDMIIADEGHKIKTHNTSASKALHRLGAVAQYRMLLTGTPLTNKAIDIFSQYKFLEPAIYGQSFYAFRSRYFDMTGYGLHTPVMKPSVAEEFSGKLHSVAFRATKAECLDLPETTVIIRRVELEPAAQKLYKNLVEESFAELDSGGEVTATNILTRLLRLSQLTGGFLNSDDSAKARQISTAKLSVLEDIIDASIQEGQKLVVIARFIPELRAICGLLEKKMVLEGLDLRPGQSLLIDTDTLEIIVDDHPRVDCWVTGGSFFQFKNGENILALSDNASRRNLQVTVIWADRYL